MGIEHLHGRRLTHSLFVSISCLIRLLSALGILCKIGGIGTWEEYMHGNIPLLSKKIVAIQNHSSAGQSLKNEETSSCEKFGVCCG